MTARRAERAKRENETTPEAETILGAAASLLAPGSKEAEQWLALRLATVGLRLPHGNKTDLVNALLALQVPIRLKRELLTVLALNGEIVAADLVMDGIKNWVAAAEKERWRREQEQWDLDRWLALLLFSDRPRDLLEALDMVGESVGPVRPNHDVVTALEHAPGQEVEDVLAELGRRGTKLFAVHVWIRTLLTRGTLAAYMLLLDVLCGSASGERSARSDAWWIAETVAGFLRSQPEFRDELLRRYEDTGMSVCHGLIEQILAERPDNRSILAVVRRCAIAGKGLDSSLRRAIEHVALEQRPVQGWQNAYELHSVDIGELRKQLFALVAAAAPGAPIAVSCLTEIDRLRDEHGHPDLEPRHPDIGTGLAWPVVLA